MWSTMYPGHDPLGLPVAGHRCCTLECSPRCRMSRDPSGCGPLARVTVIPPPRAVRLRSRAALIPPFTSGFGTCEPIWYARRSNCDENQERIPI